MAKLLVVDDSSTIRTLLSRALLEEGHEVVEAPNGSAGLRCLREEPGLQAAIVDVHMPDMGGIDMLEAWAGAGRLAMPVFVLSAESGDPMVERARALGVAAWFVKPVDLVALRNALRHHLT